MRRPCAVWLGLALCLPALLCAQQPGPLEEPGTALHMAPRPAPAFDAPEGLIHLDVTVADRAGKPVSGLETKDFTLLDSGQPRKILSFHAFDGVHASPDGPEAVILVLDTLNLPADWASAAERAIDKVLRSNGGHLAQPVSVYLLSLRGVSVTTPVSSTDGNALADQLASRKTMRSLWFDAGSAWFGTAEDPSRACHRNELSLKALGSMAIEERQRPGRKQLFWIGYGWPSGNNCLPPFDFVTEFSTRLREARITLSTLSPWPNPDAFFELKAHLGGVKSEKQLNPSSLALQVLATQSGGRVATVPSDLAGAIDESVRTMSTYYRLSFDPPRAGQVDEYHDLKVQMGDPSLEARTRMGYYDEPVFYDEPAPALEPVTVAQLEQRLAAEQGSFDGTMAKELSGLVLTERMSSAMLQSWLPRMHGEKSRAALVVLADNSAFLDPPKETIPALPAPDVAAQRQMLARMVDYLGKTIPRLPNFFAVRATTHYRELPQKEGDTWKTALGDHLLRTAGNSSATVLYRNGYDAEDPSTLRSKGTLRERNPPEIDLGAFENLERSKPPRGQERDMDTRGTFGPILSTVILDAAHSNLTWGGWEPGTSGMAAVFHYAVPEGKSHYEVTYCCLVEGDGTAVFRQPSGYHGEIRIDPDTGAILRLTVQADLKPRLPIERSDVLVEYAPQSIGGTIYTCPARSLTLWRGRRRVTIHEWGGSFRVYGPFETMLDDVKFSQYHLFRGEARILTGDEAPPEQE